MCPQPLPPLPSYKSVIAKLHITPLGCYIVYVFSLLTAESRDMLLKKKV